MLFETNTENISTLKLVKIDRTDLNSERIFYLIFAYGIIIEIDKKWLIKDFICKKIGISEKYFEEKINTIFFNGKVVDSIETTFVVNGSILALSASMPGLVGAMFRKSGTYSSLRKEISLSKDINLSKNDCYKTNGYVKLKMFNSVAETFALKFLREGVLIDNVTFDFLIKRNFIFASKYKIFCHK